MDARRYWNTIEGFVTPLTQAISGKEAADYLHRQLVAVESECFRQAGAYPSQWWLFYLRLLSPTIFACNTISYSRLRGYTERISSYGRPAIQELPSMPGFGPAQAKRAVRLAVSCIYVEEMYSALTSVNAGAELLPTEKGIKVHLPEDLARALEAHSRSLLLNDLYLYTNRLGAPYLRAAKPGTNTSRAFLSMSMPNRMLTLERLARSPADELTPFLPTVAMVNDSIANIPWVAVDVRASKRIRALGSVLRVALAEASMFRDRWQIWHESGFTLHHAQYWQQNLEQLLSEANTWGREHFGGALEIGASELISFLSEVEGGRSNRYWGPVVRFGGGSYSVDLVSATLRFESAIADALSGGGKASTHRGKVWEDTVQSVIDGSAWRLDPAARAFVSRKVRYDRQVLTDLDALAAKNETLMVVSCKSWQLRPNLDTGDFGARRNKAQDLIAAASKLQNDLAKIKSYLDATGEIFRSFTKTVGVVCLSTPLLLLPRELDELRTACPDVQIVTLPELERQLNGGSISDPGIEFAPIEYVKASYGFDMTERN